MSHSPPPDGGRPAYKRQRVGLACSSCRRRKTRCDGVRPVCASCTQLGLICSYEQPPQNASDPFTTYETRLTAVEDMLRQLVDGSRPVPGHLLDSYTQAQTVSHPHSPVDREDNLAAPRASLVDMREQQLGTPLELTIDVLASANGKSEHFFGPSSNVTFIRAVSSALDVVSNWKWRGPKPNIREGEPLISRTPSPGPPTMGPLADGPVDPFVLPHDRQTSRLLDEYFTTTGLLFPHVDEASVRQRLTEARAVSYTGMHISFLCLLNAIFAAAARVDDAPLEDEARAQSVVKSEGYFARALHLVNFSRPNQCTVETVQCLLLLCQYRQGTRDGEETSALHARALRLAIQLGLHVQHPGTTFSPRDQEVRKRTWLSCVILDKVISMTFGWPQSVSSRASGTFLPLEANLSTLSTSPSAISSSRPIEIASNTTECFFTATIELYRILSTLLTTTYADNCEPALSSSLETILETGLAVDKQLSKWEKGLPSRLTLTPWDPNYHGTGALGGLAPVFERLSSMLRLRFLHVRMLSDRAILSWHLAAMSSTSGQCPLTSMADNHCLGLAHCTLQRLRNTATETLIIICRMSNQPGALGAWWFSASYIFHACLVLLGSLVVQLNFARQSSVLYDLARRHRMTRRESDFDDLEATIRRGRRAMEKVLRRTRKAGRIMRALDRVVETSCVVLAALRQDAISVLSPPGQLPEGPFVEIPQQDTGEPMADSTASLEYRMHGNKFQPDQSGQAPSTQTANWNGQPTNDDGPLPDWQMLFESYHQSLNGISDDLFNINDLMNM